MVYFQFLNWSLVLNFLWMREAQLQNGCTAKEFCDMLISFPNLDGIADVSK